VKSLNWGFAKSLGNPGFILFTPKGNLLKEYCVYPINTIFPRHPAITHHKTFTYAIASFPRK
jgi:hypothetical protein